MLWTIKALEEIPKKQQEERKNWKEIHFPSDKKDWKKFESKSKPNALNVLHVPYNTKEIRPSYISKYNSIRKNQAILLMITDNKKWHYLAVKNFVCFVLQINIKE